MIKDSIYKRYLPETDAPEGAEAEKSYWFIFSGSKLLVCAEVKLASTQEDRFLLPLKKCEELSDISMIRKQYLGTIDGIHSFSAEAAPNAEAPEGYEYRDLKSLYGLMEDDLFLVAGRAIQIVSWDSTNQFCSRCGAPVTKPLGEIAKKCPACGLLKFPQICPAIIVAVIKEDKILLAHNKNFREGLFGVVAGFLEVGETFEDCVKREVREEVGVEVKNITYFRSQPWPFPNSLMVAFTAEYESGELKPDGLEIEEAGWFGIDYLPVIPSPYSVARQLIDWFIAKQK